MWGFAAAVCGGRRRGSGDAYFAFYSGNSLLKQVEDLLELLRAGHLPHVDLKRAGCGALLVAAAAGNCERCDSEVLDDSCDGATIDVTAYEPGLAKILMRLS